jgi:cytochrome b subunit of formate dehydrogenase
VAQQHPSSKLAAAAAGTVLASVLLVLGGVLGITQGIAAISKDEVYAAVGRYAYKLSLESWGWIHLVLGVLLLVTGIAVYTGAVVARAIGVLLTLLMMVANFLYLPYQPFWSVIMIGLGLFMIWALLHDVGPNRG